MIAADSPSGGRADAPAMMRRERAQACSSVRRPSRGDAGVAPRADLGAVAAGTTAVDVAEKLSSDLVAKGLEPIEIQKYPTFPAEVGAVKSGKADAVLEVDVALADAVRTAPDAFELVPSVFPIDGSLAVYSSKDSGVAAAVTQAWQNLIADGTAAALAEKYGIPVENLTAD